MAPNREVRSVVVLWRTSSRTCGYYRVVSCTKYANSDRSDAGESIAWLPMLVPFAVDRRANSDVAAAGGMGMHVVCSNLACTVAP